MDWACVPHCCNVPKHHLPAQPAFEHPLRAHAVTVVDSKGTRPPSLGSSASSRSSSLSVLAVDPLTATSPFDGTDPLSQFARQEQEFSDPLNRDYDLKSKRREKSAPEDNTLNWNSRRLGILNRFNTTEKLSIMTSFLPAGTNEHGSDIIRAQTVLADKVKYRLEQLDDFDDGSMRHMMDLSQQEYIQRIELLKQELVQSWHTDQRVKALKIAIQCAKLLSDASVLQFYPSQYVLITDILDAFGKLVFDRLRLKCGSEKEQAGARETCQNWFFKIASFRDLLPRLYVEMAIIRCYEFLAVSNYEPILLRLSRMLRGIADPLVCTYARCYLVRVGLSVTKSRTYMRQNIQDFISIYPVIFRITARFNSHPEVITPCTYLSLYAPALDFMLQALVYKCELYAEEILNECKSLEHSATILASMLNAFTPEFIASNAIEFTKHIVRVHTVGTSQAQLLRVLGNSISSCAILPEQRGNLLELGFAAFNTFTDPYEYINCVETWTRFIVENFTLREINRFLADIIARMSVGKAYRKHYTQLQGILVTIMQHCKHIEQLFVQDNFLPYLDLFHKDTVRTEVCKQILLMFKESKTERVADAVVTNSLMYIGKILNDSVNALTVEDERRQISLLINVFIQRVNFGRDFEQQLNFYVDARATFSNLEAVYVTLVHAVNKLAVETYRHTDGNHTPKGAAFVRACNAYCYITIPTIKAVHTKMDLYLLTGQVALLNQCLGQADDCFETAINLLCELPAELCIDGKTKSTETYLTSFLSNMLSTLVVVPDNLEQGVLYLLRLLLASVAKYPFKVDSPAAASIYLHALDMLYVQSLEVYPYHIPKVISNDELYGHDAKFIAEVNRLCSQLVDDILSQLKALGLSAQSRQQAGIALELFLRIVRYADLSKDDVLQLAVNLWLLAYKAESYLDAKLIPNTLKSVEEIYKQVKDVDSKRAKSIAQLLRQISKI